MNSPFRALQRGMANLLARAVIRSLNSAAKCQTVDIGLVAGDEKNAVEHLEPYGFTAAAHPGAEALAFFLGGDRSHGVVLAVADRRYRLTGLKNGEVAIYTDEGDSIVLKRGRIIEATTDQFIINAATKITLNTPVVSTPGKIMADKSIESATDVKDATGTMSRMREQYNIHDHNDTHGGQTGKANQEMN
ncbi:phage baseplate assembly protein V [Serratia odorifera]|uniref:Bacteriophage Mu Gp45 protein n=2 Tax=Serratia odorifera TaxID=618 RepID=D4DVS7_SEROD|nr:phage baseplate assembly protein V [Serratia odorifera]EFE98313.1 bacteriophage Mu Gp45 protein [Serratia odorifera DSM 4582]PNK92718.1 phage baseplate assembly protein V [Serratia odorifera]RII73891.1 phage baseplate assembly protein V [Serratia odorifera]VDZ51479.1 Mu-like prophage protein gp45 [Serratia odorifera]